MLTPALAARLRQALKPFLRLSLMIGLALTAGLGTPALIIALREGSQVREEGFQQLKDDLGLTAEVCAEAMREPLWQLYPELGQTVAEAVFRDPRLRLLRIHDTEHKTPFLLFERPLASGEEVLSITRDVNYKGRLVGHVELSISTAQTIRLAQQAQQQILIRTLIGLVFSLLLIFLVLRWQLVQPIAYLKQMSTRLANQALDEPISLQRSDELGDLANSLESTRISLARAFAELEDNKLALQEHADALEHRVSTRTRELADSNERLSQVIDNLSRAQSELIEADRLASLGRMVAGIAHELNTPLGSCLTMVSTMIDHHRSLSHSMTDGKLSRTQFDEFVASMGEGLHISERNILRAAEMVNKFRQVAVDQTSEQRRAFDLKVFADEVLITLSPSFKRTHIELETRIPDGLLLDSFPGPLGQVINNLLMNALIHAFDEKTDGHIWLSADSPEAERIRISIRDDGAGMSATVREHIFDPFYTTRLGRGGSGLGLAIVYNIVTGILGGRIQVLSKPDEGAEFILDIPLSAPIRADSNASKDSGYV